MGATTQVRLLLWTFWGNHDFALCMLPHCRTAQARCDCTNTHHRVKSPNVLKPSGRARRTAPYTRKGQAQKCFLSHALLGGYNAKDKNKFAVCRLISQYLLLCSDSTKYNFRCTRQTYGNTQYCFWEVQHRRDAII